MFKLREGMPIGAKVTLRGDRMYEFLDRFVTIALPVMSVCMSITIIPRIIDRIKNFNDNTAPGAPADADVQG